MYGEVRRRMNRLALTAVLVLVGPGCVSISEENLDLEGSTGGGLTTAGTTTGGSATGGSTTGGTVAGPVSTEFLCGTLTGTCG